MWNRALSLGRDLIERGAWFFAPLSWVWAAVAYVKNKAYDRSWIRPHRVSCTVVSVGNLIAGGTGKTPVVQKIALSFPSRRVAILSRGYGKIPDEAMMLRRHLPHVRIYVGKNRVALAKRAVLEGAELLLLDDGFQYRRLHRDFDIVLLRGGDPFGRGHYLPWGLLRESPKRLEKADAVFVSGIDFAHTPSGIFDEQEQRVVSIQGWKVGLFCGIGNPSSFKTTVSSLGAEVVAEWILADHEIAHPFSLERFAIRCKRLAARALVTTEKDFVKRPRSSLPILFIGLQIRWIGDLGKWEKLIAKIDRNIDNGSAYGRLNKNYFT